MNSCELISTITALAAVLAKGKTTEEISFWRSFLHSSVIRWEQLPYIKRSVAPSRKFLHLV